MRVLQVVPGMAARTGGPATSVTTAVTALRDQGVECTILTPDLGGLPGSRGDLKPEDMPEGATELSLEICRSLPPRRLAFSPELWSAARRLAADHDVVHIHSLFVFPQYAGFRAAVKTGTPHVVSPRGSLDWWCRQKGRGRKLVSDVLWQRPMFESAAAIHVTTAAEREMTSDYGPAVRRFVIPNVVDTDFWSQPGDPQGFRDRYLDGHAGPIVAFVSRIARKKRPDVVVEAFIELAPENAMLVIAGPDDEGLRPGLEKMLEDAGMRSRARFVGHLPRQPMRDLVKAASAWVLPSETENFSNASAEAIAAGAPVILSRGVGLATDAERSGAALVIDGPDSKALAARLRELLGNPQLGAELSARASAFGRGYGPDVVASELLAMYEAVSAHK